MIVTGDYLIANPNHIFVFGDNLKRVGRGGGASLRDFSNTYGFVTKKAPNNEDPSFYRPEEYLPVFNLELQKLEHLIRTNPGKLFLISKLGAGLANRYRIFENVIGPGLHVLKRYPNVRFLWM